MMEYIRLKKSNCKNCYKCIRHCPVKSIRFTGNQAYIVNEECILCGQCFVNCPQNAKVVRDDVEKAKVLLMDNEKVIASIAPSFVANYDNITIKSVEKALKQLGFAAVEETAVGATMVKKQYEEMVAAGRHEAIISSCCHSVNVLIQKYFPEALGNLAPVVTPMNAHCTSIKEREPDAKTVFIGPCISKKAEAETYDGVVDCVLTFEELTQWLDSEGIPLEEDLDASPNNDTKARVFPLTGGILRTMDCVKPGYTFLAIDGVENCITAIRDIIDGKLQDCFIEMSACVGSCIGGPVMDKNHRLPVTEYMAVNRYAGRQDFPIPFVAAEKIRRDHCFISMDRPLPGEGELAEILRQMGKIKQEDELNCGSCGYNTCREKAVAVFQGKADLSMCLPFLKDKAESVSDNILNNSPNAILVLNDKLEVQQINRSALDLINMRNATDVLGSSVVRILDPRDFVEIQETGHNIRDRKVYLAEYKRHVEETIVYDPSYHTYTCIMRDITDSELEREQKEQISQKTIEITDQVIEKQMRVVQEIASLLGETTAESKVALTKLKGLLSDE